MTEANGMPFAGNLDDHFEGPIEVLEFVTVRDHIRKRTVKAVLAACDDPDNGCKTKATFVTECREGRFMATLNVPTVDGNSKLWFLDYIHDALSRPLAPTNGGD